MRYDVRYGNIEEAMWTRAFDIFLRFISTPDALKISRMLVLPSARSNIAASEACGSPLGNGIFVEDNE